MSDAASIFAAYDAATGYKPPQQPNPQAPRLPQGVTIQLGPGTPKAVVDATTADAHADGANVAGTPASKSSGVDSIFADYDHPKPQPAPKPSAFSDFVSNAGGAIAQAVKDDASAVGHGIASGAMTGLGGVENLLGGVPSAIGGLFGHPDLGDRFFRTGDILRQKGQEAIDHNATGVPGVVQNAASGLSQFAVGGPEVAAGSAAVNAAAQGAQAGEPLSRQAKRAVLEGALTEAGGRIPISGKTVGSNLAAGLGAGLAFPFAGHAGERYLVGDKNVSPFPSASELAASGIISTGMGMLGALGHLPSVPESIAATHGLTPEEWQAVQRDHDAFRAENAPVARLPAPVVSVDSQGNAATAAQSAAERARLNSLGLTPDVQRAQAVNQQRGQANVEPNPNPVPGAGAGEQRAVGQGAGVEATRVPQPEAANPTANGAANGAPAGRNAAAGEVKPPIPAASLEGVGRADRIALSAMYADNPDDAAQLLALAKSSGAHQSTLDAVKDALDNPQEAPDRAEVAARGAQAGAEGRQPGEPSHAWGPLQRADVGLAGGANDTLTGGYLDHRIPKTITTDGKTYDPEPYIRHHEDVESHLMKELGFRYQHAHAVAQAAENAKVAAEQGVNPDHHQQALTEGIREARKAAPGGDVPADLDAQPYEDSDTTHLLGEPRGEPERAGPKADPALAQRYFDDIGKEIGWDQVGGRIVRGPEGGAATGGEAMMGGNVTGRTKWVGKPRVDNEGESGFWRNRPDSRLTEAQAHAALAKAKRGEPLRPIEQRFLDYAHQTANEYAQEFADEMERHEQAHQEQNDIQRQQDIEALRQENARFASTDAGEALTLHDWITRALDAGVPAGDLAPLIGTGTMGERVARLAQAIRERGREHGTDTGTNGLDHAGNDQVARQGQAPELQPPSGGAAESSEGPRGDLFPAATSRERLRAAAEAKDAQRNGLNRREPTPAFTSTDLGATPHGEAPEQARIPENVDEVSESALSPEDRALVEQVRGRAQRKQENDELAGTMEQESREGGERDADELGLRPAVEQVLGKRGDVHFVRDEDGLPADVRGRGEEVKKGNVRYGLHTKDGQTYIFTEHANTPERAVWTALHEVEGHGGLASLVKRFANVKLGGKSVADLHEQARKIALQNPTVRKLAEVIGKQRGSKDMPRMAEEALAELRAAKRTGDWDEIARKYGAGAKHGNPEWKSGADIPQSMRDGIDRAQVSFVQRIKRILNAIANHVLGRKQTSVFAQAMHGELPEVFSDKDVSDLLDRMGEASKYEDTGAESFASEEPADRGTMPQVATDKNVAGKQSERAAGDEARRGARESPYAEGLAQRRASAARMRANESSLADYGEREQREWLRGEMPPRDGNLTIYRAVRKGEGIQPGDYVTHSRAYAEQHLHDNMGGDGEIVSVPAHMDELFPADGPGEFWYAPRSLDGSYAPARSGANVEFSEESAQDTTGVKNEQVKSEREARGLEELHAEGKRSFGRVWDSADARLRADPQAGQSLAQSIIEKPRALSAEETALLTQDRARIAVQRRQAADEVTAAIKSGDEAGEGIARAKLMLANQQMEVNDKAARQSGYEQGLGLAIRKAMAKLDYSQEAMESRLAAAKGKPLDEKDIKRVADIHQKLQDVETELAGREQAQRGKQKETQGELFAKLRETTDQWRKGRNANTRQDKIRQGQLAKQILELKRRIEEGDYSKVKRTPIQYNEDTNRLLAKRNFLRRQFDRLAQQSEYQHQHGKVYRAVSTLIALHRAILLSSLRTAFVKLPMAALYRIVFHPAEHIAQGALSHVPGIRGIADKASIEGHFSAGAEWRALRATFSKQDARDMLEKLLHGQDSYDLLYDEGHVDMLHPWLSMVGRIHAALHTPPQVQAWTYAMEMQAKSAARQLAKAGKTPEEVASFLGDYRTQAQFAARAYVARVDAAFMGKNWVLDLYNGMLGQLHSRSVSDKEGAALAGAAHAALKYSLPIVRFPSNYVGEVTSYAAGSMKAAAELLIRRGVKNLTPDQADYIMRNLGKQTIGALFMALGYYGYKHIGSFYQDNDNKRKNIPKSETFYGLPRYVVDSPLGEAMTIGATMRRMDEGIPRKNGNGNLKGTGGVGNALKATTLGVLRDVPFFEQFSQIGANMSAPLNLPVTAGKYVTDFIPPDVKRLASSIDNHTPRKPETFTQSVEMGVPGLRQNVPAKRRANPWVNP